MFAEQWIVQVSDPDKVVSEGTRMEKSQDTVIKAFTSREEAVRWTKKLPASVLVEKIWDM